MKGKINTTYEQIKRQNGEHFAQAVRSYDNGIFDVPNIVGILKYAGRDAAPILPYLESLKKIEIAVRGDYPDPITLLKQAGYNAYYVKTHADQNAIYKYFEPGEKLCTFDDPNRFRNFHIINAVREDADRLNREDFRGKECREDAYATSVISIQILKIGGLISIKNRYNDTVENSDNTFGSNPDKIIPGLSMSLLKQFGVNFSSQDVVLPDYYLLLGEQIIRYNHTIGGCFFGPNFYVRDGLLYSLDTDKEFMLDSCIINLKEKTVRTPLLTEPLLKKVLEDEFAGPKLSLTRTDKRQYKIITPTGAMVEVKDGCITRLHLATTRAIGNGFMFDTQHLTHFSAPRLEQVGLGFLGHNLSLEYLNLPCLKKAGGGFLAHNHALRVFMAPELTEVGCNFLKSNTLLKNLVLPKLQTMGKGAFSENPTLAVQFQSVIGKPVIQRYRRLLPTRLPKVENYRT